MALLWQMCHLCMFNVMIFCVVVRSTSTTPLCGRTDASLPSKDSDQIYFPDQHGEYHTMEINGTVITCDSDGMIVSTNKVMNKTRPSDIEDDQLDERVQNDDNQKPHGIVREIQTRSFTANVSQCAENDQNFCVSRIDYPNDYIRKLLKTFSHDYNDVFGTDLTTNEVAFRIDTLDDEYLCESYEKVIYPTAGKTQDGKELYILNTETHKQGVRVSMCRNIGEPCKMADSFPIGIKTECKQQMVYRELLSLSPKGEPVKDHFEFPACCSCVLHRIV